MIDTKKFDFHHYAKKYFFTAHDSKKRAATLNRRAATVKGGQPRFTEKIRAPASDSTDSNTPFGPMAEG